MTPSARGSCGAVHRAIDAGLAEAPLGTPCEGVPQQEEGFYRLFLPAFRKSKDVGCGGRRNFRFLCSSDAEASATLVAFHPFLHSYAGCCNTDREDEASHHFGPDERQLVERPVRELQESVSEG
eukprot:scaffold489_cov259-Pinguiococcus_pyrenoidosus.AAC.1